MLNCEDGFCRSKCSSSASIGVRKALGERPFGNRYISNIAGGDYSFVGSVVCIIE